MDEKVENRSEIIKKQREEWSDKLSKDGSKQYGYAHFWQTVIILEGDPSTDVLRNFADDWGYNFGGHASRYKENGVRKARVKVYTD